MSVGKKPNEEDPRETPLDDPRQETDWPNTKQTDQPWKGKVEKDQQNKDTDIDLEKWQEIKHPLGGRDGRDGLPCFGQ